MAGNRLMALDAATGTPAAGFGTNGVVEIGVPYNGTPTIYRNVVVIGANVNEVPQGPPGNPRAFDARTGGSYGSSRPFRKPGENTTTPGATAGRIAPAPTCGASRR